MAQCKIKFYKIRKITSRNRRIIEQFVAMNRAEWKSRVNNCLRDWPFVFEVPICRGSPVLTWNEIVSVTGRLQLTHFRLYIIKLLHLAELPDLWRLKIHHFDQFIFLLKRNVYFREFVSIRIRIFFSL